MQTSSNSNQISNINRYFILLLISTSILIAISLIWSGFSEKKQMKEFAIIQAKATFDRDILYRSWSAQHGGVYAPQSTNTKPNPYLDEIIDRDIETSSGKKLTLINPAYMTRQVHELGAERFGVYAHITSLNPIRPKNKANEWETMALIEFEKGVEEMSSVEIVKKENYLFYMQPLITEKSCLKCHEKQGYQIGDIRGGIRISIPMNPILEVSQPQIIKVVIIHIIVWVVALTSLIVGRRNFIAVEKKKNSAEAELINHKNNLENLVSERTLELNEKNNSLSQKNEELAKYNELFVGREFRIKELKDKIIDLEAKNKTNG
ncbi:MAG: DUF3365 domain-containing protein [Bacteroidetes bacterium]|nr:DUF3365 domain-containing protein [Bacteroidota bacterium]